MPEPEDLKTQRGWGRLLRKNGGTARAAREPRTGQSECQTGAPPLETANPRMHRSSDTRAERARIEAGSQDFSSRDNHDS